MENYLQRAWSDATDNVGILEIHKAVAELKEMDDEHDAFWVTVVADDETILEVDKHMNIILVSSNRPENALKRQLNTWEEVLSFYELLLNEEFELLQLKMQK